MNEIEFGAAFTAVAGNAPFPWQWELYQRFVSDRPDNIPSSCNLPTGLGKTSVIHIWLLALAYAPDRVPRRLVYVVNRRTVVDQSTDEARKLRERLLNSDKYPQHTETLKRLSAALAALTADAAAGPLAISTLRGQFADNREWSADPSRPAVICGTVDMIGSRLLFSGYGCGFKSRPLHAGFLGQNVLLVHDEAHLEPAFQKLIVAIRDEQKREPAPLGEHHRLRVLALTATPRDGEDQFELTKDERTAPEDIPERPTEPLHVVWQRLKAKKGIKFIPVKPDRGAVAAKIGELATSDEHKNSGGSILVFVRTIEDVGIVTKAVERAEKPYRQLTGTLRGKERDELIDHPVFQRFIPDAVGERAQGTVYLICTSAGEVGVDISADDLVCDLTPFDSMAQRFGRVNRRGGNDRRAHIDIVHESEPDEKNEYDRARALALKLLRALPASDWDATRRDASPAALDALRERTDLPCKIEEAYSPTPTILPTSDILFDAWALTTIRGKLPGRPIVEPYLHGVEDETSDTEFAWREEVRLLTGKVAESALAELMDDFPLKPHEVLRVTTFGKGRAYEQLEAIVERTPNLPAWVIEPDGELIVYNRLSDLVAKKGKGFAVPLASRTVVLPPKAGGLTASGTLNGAVAHDPTLSYDVAGTPPGKISPLLRLKVVSGEEGASFKLVAPIRGWGPEFSVEYQPGEKRFDTLNEHLAEPVNPARSLDLTSDSDDEPSADGVCEYMVVKPISRKKPITASPEWPILDVHRKGVKGHAEQICSRLGLPRDMTRAVVLAAWWHDLGKGRRVWQRGAGNQPNQMPVSKPIHGRPPENLNHFRHELGSMIDACGDPALAAEFTSQEQWAQDLTLHLIAAHHGRARPHFPVVEATDPERLAVASEMVAAETPARFARLQRRFGRWGLAYLESLIRAADALDSRRIEETPLGDEEAGSWPGEPAGFSWPSRPAMPEPTIRVAVDPTNPGHFFACCGLLEMADRLWPGAEGWFADGRFNTACGGTLHDLLASAQQIQFGGNAEEEAEDGEEDEDEQEKAVVTPLEIVAPVTMRLDWWQDINLKPWAGSMNARNIALAMCRAINPDHPDPLNQSQVVLEVKEAAKVTKGGKPPKPKPKEPFHFDARRGANSLGRDVGFIHDTLKKKWKTPMFAHPVVEFFALLGLQRSRPQPTEKPRVYDYFTWTSVWRCQAPVLPLAVCGLLGDPQACRYRFVNAFRTGKKRHKAYMPAVPVPSGDRT